MIARYWRRRQQDHRRRTASSGEDTDLVFTTRSGNPLHPQNLLQRDFYPLLERLELPKVRFHDLRHTTATLPLSAGVRTKIVSELLGHTDVGITLNLYSHVIPGLHERAAAAFDELLTPHPEEPPADAYDGPAPAAAALAVNLAVSPRSTKAKVQVSPRSSGDRASVS
jgi:integrase